MGGRVVIQEIEESIWKFSFSVGDEFYIKMPAGAQILHAGPQGNSSPLEVYIWALVNTDPDAPQVKRRFALRGTGHPCDKLGDARHVSTFMLHDGALVFHLFDRGEEEF